MEGCSYRMTCMKVCCLGKDYHHIGNRLLKNFMEIVISNLTIKKKTTKLWYMPVFIKASEFEVMGYWKSGKEAFLAQFIKHVPPHGSLGSHFSHTSLL